MNSKLTAHFREITPEDLPEVFRVRTATTENAITRKTLTSYGITVESLTEALATDAKGWVAEVNRRIVGFCIGNRASGEIEVLAVLPDHEGLGIGKGVLQRTQNWLFDAGHQQLHLVTSPEPDFRAYIFYQHQGWRPTGIIEDQDERFLLDRGDAKTS